MKEEFFIAMMRLKLCSGQGKNEPPESLLRGPWLLNSMPAALLAHRRHLGDGDSELVELSQIFGYE
jgi:hypothetical protein